MHEPNAEWLIEWLTVYKKDKIKKSTYTEYERQIKTIIAPVLGHFRLQEIRLSQVQAMLNDIPRDNTRKKVFTLLNCALQKATLPTIGYLRQNPCYGVELPKRKIKEHRRAYTLEEQNTLLSVLPERYAKAFFFLCCTGLRLGEFLALTTKDIDFENQVILINKACDKKMNISTPKTLSSVREVYSDKSLFDFFPLEYLGSYTHNGFHCQFVRTLKKYGIQGVCIHSTRHTFATLCDFVGIRDKLTQAMLGHATLSMTKDTYTHLYKKGNSPILEYVENLKNTLENTIKIR